MSDELNKFSSEIKKMQSKRKFNIWLFLRKIGLLILLTSIPMLIIQHFYDEASYIILAAFIYGQFFVYIMEYLENKLG